MKKLLVIMLVLAMVFGMSGVAFAVVPDPEPVPITAVDLSKVFELVNENTKSPAETFNFYIENIGVTNSQYTASNMPGFGEGPFEIDFAKGEATQVGDKNSTTLVLPNYNHVGIFTYKVTEEPGDTAGVYYDNSELLLTIYVTNSEDEGAEDFTYYATLKNADMAKVEGFTNNFSAGDLTIKKVIDGNFGEPTDTFEVIVTLTPRGNKVIEAEPILAENGNKVVDQDGTVTITYTVTNGSEFTIQNIPYDVDYTVEETANDMDYIVSYDDNARGEFKSATIETTITNTRETDVPVGVNLDNLPYIIILIGAIGGLFVFTIRKRFAK